MSKDMTNEIFWRATVFIDGQLWDCFEATPKDAYYFATSAFRRYQDSRSGVTLKKNLTVVVGPQFAPAVVAFSHTR